MQPLPHIPVMISNITEILNDFKNKKVIDCTFGFGGYSKEFLRLGANVLAIDQDPNVYAYAEILEKEYKNFTFSSGNFSNIYNIAKSNNYMPADYVVMDIGVSSMQIDTPERGFSFMHDGPLDMRMSASGRSAYDVVNSYRENDLADVIYQYGGEKKSRRIAAKIVAERKISKIDTTSRLANIVRSCVKKSFKNPIDPATRTFQAIRIEVNSELDALKEGLKNAKDVIGENGKIAVVTFHSLEDRIVKHYFRELAQSGDFKLLTKKPILPNNEEINLNPRSRSAKLRVIEKTSRGES